MRLEGLLKNPPLRIASEVKCEKIVQVLMRQNGSPIHVSELARKCGFISDFEERKGKAKKSIIDYYLIGNKQNNKPYGGFLKDVIDKTSTSHPNQLTYVKLKPSFAKRLKHVSFSNGESNVTVGNSTDVGPRSVPYLSLRRGTQKISPNFVADSAEGILTRGSSEPLGHNYQRVGR